MEQFINKTWIQIGIDDMKVVISNNDKYKFKYFIRITFILGDLHPDVQAVLKPSVLPI